jgi:phage regulator Rha-like protein
MSPNGAQTMTSREVVQIINSLRPEGKAELRHDHFVAKLLKLKEELNLPNIWGVEYLDKKGEKRPEYLLDKEACMIMVASETPKVLQAIIRRWQELEAQVAQKPLSPMEMVIWSAQRIMQIEAEQEAQAKQLENLSSDVREIKASNNAVLQQSDYFSVMGYCNLVGIKATLSQASGYSRSLGAICKKLEIQRKETVDPRFGRVWMYNREVLQDFFVKKGLISI